MIERRVPQLWTIVVLAPLPMTGGVAAADDCAQTFVEDFSAFPNAPCPELCEFDPVFSIRFVGFSGPGCFFGGGCSLYCIASDSWIDVSWSLPEPQHVVTEASVQLRDNCGAGCTTATFIGAKGAVSISNQRIGVPETAFATSAEIGEILAINLQSSEGFFDTISLVSTPAGVGDIDASGAVDGADLGLLLANWGDCGSSVQRCNADLNCDGVVNGGDLGLLLGNWGSTGR